MKTPLISIIVPIYNAERTLERCVNSILVQTHMKLECILIDDGSTDGSAVLCDGFSQRDARVKVFHQKNAGVSAARNTGLDIATGNYIGFVDSDDWIEPNMYEMMFSDICKTNAEITICGFSELKQKRSVLLSPTEAQRLIFLPTGIGGFSWNRLINKTVIGNLRYDTEISYMEDVLFFYYLFPKCKKIYWHSIPLYHYIKNTDSVTNQYGITPQVRTAIIALDTLYNGEPKYIIRKAIHTNKCDFFIDLIIGCILNIDMENGDFIELRIVLKKNFFFILCSFYISYKKKIFLIFILFSKNIHKNFFIKSLQTRFKSKKENCL